MKWQYVDLISRKAVLEILGDPHPLDYNALSVIKKICDLSSIKVVLSDNNVCEIFETIETIDE